MRYLLLLSLLTSSVISLYSQIPEGYYSPVGGLSGNELKTALYDLIKGHTEYPYSSSSTDTWDILKESDRDTANADNVILFYTGWSVNAAQEYNNEKGWNREHVWAKSRGDFGTSPGPGTDTHHLRPSDITVNYARGNRWFDNCETPFLDDGLETGCFTSLSSWVWQPRDEVKGDVARMIFYMATRYEGENGEPDLELIDYLPSDDFTKDPVHAKLSTLLDWHMEDSVSSFEMNRNEVIYSYQGNRNPFIDHPEYANRIWGSDPGVGITDNPSRLLKVYPNPCTDVLTVEFDQGAEYTIEVCTLKGQILYRTINTDPGIKIDLSAFPGGLYLITICTKDFVKTQKVIKR